MTYLEIEAFLTTIRTGSITKASESLFISQPALSRRIKALESELGFDLIVRRKGIRTIELTDTGRAFMPIAEKWQALWRETQDLRLLDRKILLTVASVDSVSTYIMSAVYQMFLQYESETKLAIRTLHPLEAYQCVESGIVDIAFVARARYSKKVETLPAFREPMRFVCAAGSNYSFRLHPSALDVKNEIKLPWNSEYEQWHEYWFGVTEQPRVFLDKMSLLEQFVCASSCWAIVPASVANQLQNNPRIEVHDVVEGPPDRTVYYLLGPDRKPEPTSRFLHLLDNCLKDFDGIDSLL